MPHATTPRGNQNTNPAINPAALVQTLTTALGPGAQPSDSTGIRAPQGTPAGGTTPADRASPANDPTSGTNANGQTWKYGKVGLHNPEGNLLCYIDREIVEIQPLSGGDVVRLRGQDAKNARVSVGGWYTDRLVKVTFKAGTSDVERVTPYGLYTSGSGAVA